MNTKESILKQYFGYDKFREGQSFLIDNIMARKNVVGVMPTGAGKSLCYQVPAMLFEGITLVISPLISLMKDQVNALTQAGVSAAYINSSLSTSQYSQVLQNARDGKYKIIYVAPERLMTEDFFNFAQNSQIDMLTVDEAHCISQWGQDFRPSYQKISDFLNALPNHPVVSAFTATATSKVTDDIIAKLNLVNPELLVTGFDRKNLYFQVEKPKNKINSLLDFLENKKDRYGIVYCSTRKDVEKVNEILNEHGYLSRPYHAGLGDAVRSQNQDDFIFDRVNIVVATNAFGMGIDKSNVSYVVHYNMPKNMESYYQEAGRAGRDGSDSICILYYSAKDVNTNTYLIEHGQSNEYADSETEELIKSQDRERLKQMTFYCHTSDCLREYILRYFGERGSNYCGNCSNCNTNFETQDITIDSQKILSCVVRVKERYGIKTIIEVLRGSKTQRIMQLGLDELSTYGIMNQHEKIIRDIINYLILNEFLFVTADEYPVLKLGKRSSEILKERKSIEMKLSKELPVVKDRTSKQAQKLKGVNSTLLSMLKETRLRIANAQKVPAFIVFSDSTLIDMCMKLPRNSDQLLHVSGIGEVKSKRYGDKFLTTINDFLSKESEEVIKDIHDDNIIDIEIKDDNISLGVLADSINCYLLQKSQKKISGKTITSWLQNEGYISLNIDSSKNKYHAPTKSGDEIGLLLDEKIAENKLSYLTILSSKKSSQFIVDNIDKFTN